jgi:hypothetical protein
MFWEVCEYSDLMLHEGSKVYFYLKGHCRRYPPTISQATIGIAIEPDEPLCEQSENQPNFPVTNFCGWCGEFKNAPSAKLGYCVQDPLPEHKHLFDIDKPCDEEK